MKRAKKAFIGLLIMLVMVFAMNVTAFADTSYIATWDEYKTETGLENATWNDVVDAMDKLIDAGKEAFQAGDMDTAYNAINDAYYGYYETTGFERVAMGYISGSRKTEMELQFAAAKSVAQQSGSYEDYEKEADTLSDMLRIDANQLDGVTDDSSSSSSDDGSTDTSSDTSSSSDSSSGTTRSASTATFLACFGIILREGFEAILIVGAIIAYLQKMNSGDEKQKKKMVRPTYYGSILGILLSFVLAWLLNVLKLANSASQEVIEGVTALIAVAVLFYVSNWMLSKSEADAWTKYIKGKAQASVEKGSTFALAFTAFLSVFREGAEVVLFFQPLMKNDNMTPVWAGLIVGGICLIFVYLIIHFLSVTIPLKPFFMATSILMFIMSISFLGAGIKELIEGNVFTLNMPDWLSWIPSNDVMDILGIYGTLQTLIPQLILTVITIILIVVTVKKNRKIHMEAEARRAEERAIKEAEEKAEQERIFREAVTDVVIKVLTEKGLITTRNDSDMKIGGE